MALALYETAVAQWQALVSETVLNSPYVIEIELESYLVFLLMRFTRKHTLAQPILGKEYLLANQEVGEKRRIMLQAVGDSCLILSGLYPDFAYTRHVEPSYYVELGQSAYWRLGHVREDGLAPVFKDLSHHFILLVEILHKIRQNADHQASVYWKIRSGLRFT